MSNNGYSISLKKLWNARFHPVKFVSLLIPSTSLLRTIFLANAPRIFVSLLYLIDNALFTSMFLSKKWMSYGAHPRGLQRSTYYLQLPYLYAIPLLIVSTLLHWLVSQNILIAHIAVYERRGRLEFGHVQVRLLLHLDIFFAHFDDNYHCWSSVGTSSLHRR
jgi:hypothetical protein